MVVKRKVDTLEIKGKLIRKNDVKSYIKVSEENGDLSFNWNEYGTVLFTMYEFELGDGRKLIIKEEHE